MNNDSIIGVFIGIMLSIVVLYLLTGFICGVFCNNNRDNNGDNNRDNNRDNDNNTTNALDSTIVNNRRIYCVPTNVTRKTNNNIITIVVINDNVEYHDNIIELPIAKLVK
jgi:hypothetical protein